MVIGMYGDFLIGHKHAPPLAAEYWRREPCCFPDSPVISKMKEALAGVLIPPCSDRQTSRATLVSDTSVRE
jgi:hypothetical protein